MNPTECLALLFDAMNQKSLDALGDILADDAVFHFPKTAPLKGKKRIVTFMKLLFRKYPNLTFQVGRITGDPVCAAAEWTNSGDTKTGDHYENAGVTFLEMNNGKIIYLSDTFKDTDRF
ncbi:MAG: nuclear transport factor 2 family protein [Deltaproteobacteria bacterium]|nr:nuclear transport factor 2 family protein [Deltaproteobacteria bacterium]